MLVDGFSYGSISMTSYAVGAVRPGAGGASDAVRLPSTDVVPPEQSNI